MPEAENEGDEELVEVSDTETVDTALGPGRMVLVLAMAALGLAGAVAALLSDGMDVEMRVPLFLVGAFFAGFFALVAAGSDLIGGVASRLGLKASLPRERKRVLKWKRHGLDPKGTPNKRNRRP